MTAKLAPVRRAVTSTPSSAPSFADRTVPAALDDKRRQRQAIEAFDDGHLAGKRGARRPSPPGANKGGDLGLLAQAFDHQAPDGTPADQQQRRFGGCHPISSFGARKVARAWAAVDDVDWNRFKVAAVEEMR